MIFRIRIAPDSLLSGFILVVNLQIQNFTEKAIINRWLPVTLCSQGQSIIIRHLMDEVNVSPGVEGTIVELINKF